MLGLADVGDIDKQSRRRIIANGVKSIFDSWGTCTIMSRRRGIREPDAMVWKIFACGYVIGHCVMEAHEVRF